MTSGCGECGASTASISGKLAVGNKCLFKRREDGPKRKNIDK